MSTDTYEGFLLVTLKDIARNKEKFAQAIDLKEKEILILMHQINVSDLYADKIKETLEKAGIDFRKHEDTPLLRQIKEKSAPHYKFPMDSEEEMKELEEDEPFPDSTIPEDPRND